MLRRWIAVFAVVCYLWTAAFGQEPSDCPKAAEPSPAAEFIGTTVHGTALGAYLGLSAGWVRYADRHEMQNVWESAGYGALAGLGAGLTAAIVGKNGTGELVLADIDRASGVGGSFGFLWGITGALFTGDSRRIANGLAWGNLAGCVLGLGIAGYKIATEKYPSADTSDKYVVRVTGGAERLLVKVEKKF
jgi:hypothetical protein